MRGPQPRGMRKLNFKSLARVVKLLFKSYPVLVPIAMACSIFFSVISSFASRRRTAHFKIALSHYDFTIFIN